MQEFPYFHAFPSIPVLTWVEQMYPSWLADVGLSSLPYIVTILTAYRLDNTFTVCSKANAGCYLHNLCPAKTVQLDFFYCSTCVSPRYLHVDSVNIDIADVQ